jgi:hypothetical protein
MSFVRWSICALRSPAPAEPHTYRASDRGDTGSAPGRSTLHGAQVPAIPPSSSPAAPASSAVEATASSLGLLVPESLATAPSPAVSANVWVRTFDFLPAS